MAIYVILIRPYSSILSTCLVIINELLLIMLFVGTFRFIEPEISPDLSKTFGMIFVGIIAATIAINWVAIIIYGIVLGVSKKIRKIKYSKAKNNAPSVKHSMPISRDDTTIFSSHTKIPEMSENKTDS